MLRKLSEKRNGSAVSSLKADSLTAAIEAAKEQLSASPMGCVHYHIIMKVM
jgi:hypothetical protein